MRRKVAVLLSWLCLSVYLCGCMVPDPPATAETIMAAMLAEAGEDWPDGRCYRRGANVEGGDYLTDTLVSAMYGTAGRGWFAADTAETADRLARKPAVADAAIFLSTAMHPAEVAVFRCSDGKAALSVAMVCRARLEELKNHWGDGENARWTEGAAVEIKDNYVLLVVSPDPTPLLSAAARAIRSGG